MSREQLLNYQEQDAYVFHGSIDENIVQLEPRQALSFQKPDGEPAVFAAGSIEPAIFMAILGSRKLAGWDSSKFIPPFGFYISESNWQEAQDKQWRGYVYVIDKKPFSKGNGWVWRSNEHVTPVDKIPVTLTDLPKEITILSDKDEAEYVAQYS